MWNKRKRLTFERQVKNIKLNKQSSFVVRKCISTLIKVLVHVLHVKRYSIAILKLWWAIKNDSQIWKRSGKNKKSNCGPLIQILN